MRLFLFAILLSVSSLATAQTATELHAQANKAYDQKQYANAVELIEKALALDHSKVEYFFLKANALFELELYQESYNTYNEAIGFLPKEPRLYINRGNFLMSVKEYDLAEGDFTSALNLAQTDSLRSNAYLNRASAKIYKRGFESAYQDLRMAYQIDSMDIGVLTNLGAICDEIGRGDETLKYLLKAVEVDSSFYGAFVNIGFKYQELGQYKKAIEYFNKVLSMNPDEPYSFCNRSFNKLKLGDLPGAMADIETSIRLYPANSYAYRTRALIYLEKGEKDKACTDLQTALDKNFTQTYGPEVEELIQKHCKK